MTLTEEELKAIRERIHKASRYSWNALSLEFVSHAVEDISALLTEVDRLQAENYLLKEHGVLID